MGYLQRTAPGIKVFFVDQWASVAGTTTTCAEKQRRVVRYLSGSGLCDGSRPGQRDPRPEAYQQQAATRTSSGWRTSAPSTPACATDEGVLQRRCRCEAEDVTEDFNHLTVSGLAKEAAIVWELLPRLEVTTAAHDGASRWSTVPRRWDQWGWPPRPSGD